MWNTSFQSGAHCFRKNQYKSRKKFWFTNQICPFFSFQSEHTPLTRNMTQHTSLSVTLEWSTLTWKSTHCFFSNFQNSKIMDFWGEHGTFSRFWMGSKTHSFNAYSHNSLNSTLLPQIIKFQNWFRVPFECSFLMKGAHRHSAPNTKHTQFSHLCPNMKRNTSLSVKYIVSEWSKKYALSQHCFRKNQSKVRKSFGCPIRFVQIHFAHFSPNTLHWHETWHNTLV